MKNNEKVCAPCWKNSEKQPVNHVCRCTNTRLEQETNDSNWRDTWQLNFEWSRNGLQSFYRLMKTKIVRLLYAVYICAVVLPCEQLTSVRDGWMCNNWVIQSRKNDLEIYELQALHCRDICVTSVCFTPFCFSTLCQFTPPLNLRPLIFGLTPFGWLRSWTLPGEHESHGAKQNCEAAGSLQTTSRPVCSPFISDNVVYLHLLLYFLLYLQTPRWHTQSRNKTDMTMNNRNNNLTGSNMCGLWVIKWLRSRACESEFDYPWQNICDSDDMERISSVTSLISTK